MAKPVSALEVSEQQKRELTGLVRAPTTAQRTVRRARIVLLRAGGLSQEQTAQEVGVNRPVVALWERRFRSRGLAGLTDAKGRGRKSSLAPEAVECVFRTIVTADSGRT